MAIFFRCDVCTSEMASNDVSPLFAASVNDKRVDVQVTRAVDGTWNGGHLCGECLALALERGAQLLRSQAEQAAQS